MSRKKIIKKNILFCFFVSLISPQNITILNNKNNFIAVNNKEINNEEKKGLKVNNYIKNNETSYSGWKSSGSFWDGNSINSSIYIDKNQINLVNENYLDELSVEINSNFKLNVGSQLNTSGNKLTEHSVDILSKYNFSTNSFESSTIESSEYFGEYLWAFILPVYMYAQGVGKVYTSYTFSEDNDNYKINLLYKSKAKLNKEANTSSSASADAKLNSVETTIKYPDLCIRYGQLIEDISNETFKGNLKYKPSNIEMTYDNNKKKTILENYYREVINNLFNEKIVIENKIFEPNEWDVKIDIENDKILLTFIFLDFDKKYKEISFPIKSDLFLNDDSLLWSGKSSFVASDNINKKYFPDDLINFDKYKMLDIMKEIISFKNNYINEFLFKTELSIEEWNELFVDQKLVDLMYNIDNEICKISNGEVNLTFQFNELCSNLWLDKIKHNDSFEWKYLYEFTISNLKTQFDIYKNNNFTFDLDINDKTFLNNFYNNQSIDVSNKLTNYQNIFDTRPDGYEDNQLKEFILDELILYDNQNGKRLKESDNPNQYILATNLNKVDFEERQIQRDNSNNINNINIEHYDHANGRMIISVTNLDMGTPWREDKEDINGFSKTYQESDGRENKIYFALSGFKKHHDILKRNNTELDANNLNNLDNIDEINTKTINLSDFNPKEIEKAAKKVQNDELSFEELLDCLINYEYDLRGNIELLNNDKLLNTFLDEYNFIKKVQPEFIETDKIVRGDVSGTIDLNLLLSNQDNSLNYNDDIPFGGKENFDRLKSNYINFKIKGLKQDILLETVGSSISENEFDVSYIEELKSKTVNQVIEEFNKDKTYLLKNIFGTTDNLGNFRNPLFTLNGRMDELYYKNDSNGRTNSIGVIKDIVIEEQNNPMGNLAIRIKFNNVNGTFNGVKYPSVDGKTCPDDLVIKLNGFKKDIDVSNRVVEINKDVYNNSVSNQQGRELISSYESIDERFILDNLIQYSDYVWNNNIILKTNLKKEEFESYLLNQSKPIEINYDKVNGCVTGTIHLNNHNGTMTYSNSMGSFTNHINFRISGFDVDNITFIPSYNVLDITQYTENLSKMNLEKFNKSFILEKMIKYNDYNKELSNPILVTNVSKSDFVNKYLKDISIVKNNSTKSADVTFLVDDGTGNVREIKCPSIINFDAATSFIVNNRVNHQVLVNSRISDIDSNYIIDNLISYQTSLPDSTKIINTNITKEEFVNDYLNKIEFLSNENDLFNNQIKIKMLLNKPINNQIEYDFTIYTRTDKSYAIKNNLGFVLPESLANKDINDITKEDIKSLIKTNDSNITNYLFALNINKSDLDRYLSFDMHKNEKLGIIEIDFRLLNSGNKSEYDNFKVSLSGFANQINFNLNNEQIDINWYSAFDSINSLDDINEEFIINNLIKYEDSNDNSTNIIGSINLTKDEFMKLYDSMEITKNNNKLSVSIKLKNDIKHSKTLSNIINFKLTDNSIINNGSDSTMIIVLSTVIPVVVILLIIGLVILIKRYKKKKFNMEVENEI